jgi:hypothetical protein
MAQVVELLPSKHEVLSLTHSTEIKQKKPPCYSGWCWWPMPVTLATQEAEIRRTLVQSHVRPYLEK